MGQVNLGMLDNFLVLNLDDGGSVVGFYDAPSHELHLKTMAEPMHACTGTEALNVAGQYLLGKLKYFESLDVPSGVVIQ